MPVAIGLLAGVGSLLREAQDAGCKIVGNLETRRQFYGGLDLSWNLNFPEADFWPREEQLEDVRKRWQADVDLVVGHPPCGSASSLGNSKASIDTMNDEQRERYHAKRRSYLGLLPLFCEGVNALQARAFALDNLPKILRTSAPPEWWQAQLPKYHLTFLTIVNGDYGTPQRRERLWVVGVRKPGKPFVFKAPKPVKSPSVEEALEGLNWRPWRDDKRIAHVHVSPELLLNMDYRTTTQGEPKVSETATLAAGFLSLPPKCAWPYITQAGRLATKIGRARSAWEVPSPVLTGLFSAHHPITGWPMTPRERARLMDWPDDFALGNEQTQYNVLNLRRLIHYTGKAVPSAFPRVLFPQLLKHIGR